MVISNCQFLLRLSVSYSGMRQICRESTLQPKTNTTLISIVIPTFNEAARIQSTIASICKWSHQCPYPIELIIADDGSVDDTASLAKDLQNQNTELRVLELPHRGKAATVLEGFAKSNGKVVGFMDADLATPLSMVKPAIEVTLATNGVAIGSREDIGATRDGEPWVRHVMGRIFNLGVQALLLPGLEDTQCGFKFFSRNSLDTVLEYHQLYRNAKGIKDARVTAFDIEMLYIVRRHEFAITTLPVDWTYGENSKVNAFTDSWHNARDILRIRMNAWRGLYG